MLNPISQSSRPQACRPRPTLTCLLGLAALFASGCSDVFGPKRITGIQVLDGDKDGAPVGCSVPVEIRVLNSGTAVVGAPVSFRIGQGSGTLTVVQDTTDREGIARSTWLVGRGTNTVTATVSGPVAATATLSASGVPVAPRGYATVGNQIVSSVTCKPHRFLGVTRPGLEWNSWESRLDDSVLTAQDLSLIRSWKANLVRIPVGQMFGVAASKHFDPLYMGRVERVVRQARAAGLDVIIDLHTSDRGDPQYGGKIEIQQMPDLAHSVPFWKELASRFKNDGGVIFELFNEPNGVTWDVWLNGGMIPGGAQYTNDPYAKFKAPYRAVGMQQLYDAVRSTGADNLVLVGGTHWGFFLDKVKSHQVNGHNIAYASHPYDYADKQPDTWEKAFGALAATHPVVISEFGVGNCRTSYTRALLDYADRNRMSWIAWAWWAPPQDEPNRAKVICEFPSLISEWTGAPTALGQLVRARLATYPAN